MDINEANKKLEEFNKFLKNEKIKEVYDKLYKDYKNQYNKDSLEKIVKKKFDSLKKQYKIENVPDGLYDDIEHYVIQYTDNLLKEESFQHYIIFSILNELKEFPKEDKLIIKFLKKLNKRLPEDVEHFVHTIVDSIFRNIQKQANKDEELKQKNAELEKYKTLALEYNNQLKILRQDYTNLKNRINKEKENYKKEALIDVLDVFIPFLDQLSNSFNHLSEEEENSEFVKGIKMIYNQIMLELADKFEFKKIKTVGEKFDHNFHEAVLTEVNNDVEENIVLQEISGGYMLGDRVVRYAKVKISKKE